MPDFDFGELAKSMVPVESEPLTMTPETTLRKLRERIKFEDGSNLSVQKMAAFTGINPSSIRNWEYGRSQPAVSIERFSALCRLLQCDIHQLTEAYQNSHRLNATNEAEVPVDPEKKTRRRGKIA